MKSFSDLIFYALDVPPAKAFDFTAKFKVTLDGRIVQNAETVHNGGRSADHFHHRRRLQIEISLVSYGQDNGINPGQGLIQVLLDGGFLELVLVPEKPGPFF